MSHFLPPLRYPTSFELIRCGQFVLCCVMIQSVQGKETFEIIHLDSFGGCHPGRDIQSHSPGGDSS